MHLLLMTNEANIRRPATVFGRGIEYILNLSSRTQEYPSLQEHLLEEKSQLELQTHYVGIWLGGDL